MKPSAIQLFIIRLALGALMLHGGFEKYQEGWLRDAAPLRSSLESMQQHASGYQLQYLDSVAIPYASLWSKLICMGELALGISLLLGCLVRFSTLVGMLYVLNLYAANGMLYSLKFFASPWAALLFSALLALFLARAGRWIGVDAVFAKSKAKSFFW